MACMGHFPFVVSCVTHGSCRSHGSHGSHGSGTSVVPPNETLAGTSGGAGTTST